MSYRYQQNHKQGRGSIPLWLAAATWRSAREGASVAELVRLLADGYGREPGREIRAIARNAWADAQILEGD